MEHYFRPFGFVFAVMVVVLFMSQACRGISDDQNAMCYKPPPPVNSSSDHRLFHVDVQPFSPAELQVEVQSIELHIREPCGVGLVIYASVSFLFLESYVNCNFVNDSSKRAPIVSKLMLNRQSTYYHMLSVNLTVDRINASEGTLKLSCKVMFNKSAPALVSGPLLNTVATIELKGCPHARYGVECDHLCSCAPGIECHPFTGQCVCPKGLQGKLCSEVDPVLVFEGPSPLFVPYGESVLLTCAVYGMVPSRWSWYQEGRRLGVSSNRENVSYRPRPFHWGTNVTATGPEVNGNYTCRVVNNNILYSRNVTVIVTHVPDPFVEAPSSTSVLVGDSVKFHWRTKPEAGTLTLVVGNQTINQRSTDLEGSQISHQSLVVRERNQTVSVIIDSVRFEDAGRYRCIVGHEGGNDDAIADAWLTVKSPGSSKPIIANQRGADLSGRVLRIHEGQPLNLTCTVQEVYPEPRIAWLIGHQNITSKAKLRSRTSPNGVSYDVESSLVFIPSWQDNEGNMSCISDVPSLKAVASQEVILNVTYLPKVSISPAETIVQHDESPLFTCSAPANPPVTSYNWTLRQKNGSLVHQYTGSSRSVRLRALDAHQNMATLTCSATNEYGTNNSKAVIKVFDDSDDDAEVPWAIMISALLFLVFLTVVMPVLIYRHRSAIQDLFFNNRKKPEGKSHDVFVAYKGGAEDEEFVIDRLVPKLKEWGCDVCVHYQNFLPGREIVDNIMTAVGSCRKTILVLSPEFMASEWCYFEFLCAMDEMLRNQTNLIIPLMFQEIRTDELCLSMRNLLDTVSFVPWPNGTSRGHIDEFWKLLMRALETEFNVNKESSSNELSELNNNVVDANGDNIHLI